MWTSSVKPLAVVVMAWGVLAGGVTRAGASVLVSEVGNAVGNGVGNAVVVNGSEPAPLNIADGKSMGERVRLAALDAEKNARRAFGCGNTPKSCLYFRAVSNPRQLNSPSKGVFPYYVSGQVLIDGQKSICGGKSNGHGHGGHLPGNCVVEQSFTVAAPDEGPVFSITRESIGFASSIRFAGEKKDAGTPEYGSAVADARKVIRADYETAYLKNFEDRQLCGAARPVFAGTSHETIRVVPYTSEHLVADYFNSDTDLVSAATVVRVMGVLNLRSALDVLNVYFGAEAGLVAVQGSLDGMMLCAPAPRSLSVGI